MHGTLTLFHSCYQEYTSSSSQQYLYYSLSLYVRLPLRSKWPFRPCYCTYSTRSSLVVLVDTLIDVLSLVSIRIYYIWKATCKMFCTMQALIALINLGVRWGHGVQKSVIQRYYPYKHPSFLPIKNGSEYNILRQTYTLLPRMRRSQHGKSENNA